MLRFADDSFAKVFDKPGEKRVSVFGLGYVGLPVSAVLAGRGFEVIGVDVEASIVEVVNNGRVPIVEPDLDMLVQAAVSAGKLRATVEPEPADVALIQATLPSLPDEYLATQIAMLHEEDEKRHPEEGVWRKL